MANYDLALAALAAAVRRALAGQLDARAAAAALRVAELAAGTPRQLAAALAATARQAEAVAQLEEELSWRRPAPPRDRRRGEPARREQIHRPAPRMTDVPGTKLRVLAAPAALAELPGAPDGLYWLEPQGCLAARLGGVTLAGNLCVFGRGRSEECGSDECGRELRGCPRFHDPLRYPGSAEARALELPRNLRRAQLRWLPSREKAEECVATITPELASELEAVAMHALVVALAAKKELSMLPH